MNKITKTNNQIDEPKEVKKLKKKIKETKENLIFILEKLENLRVDLSVFKHEYNIKIGRLYNRLDILDLEITKLKRIHILIQEGIPLEEATKLVEGELSLKHEYIKHTTEELEDEGENFQTNKDLPKEDYNELRKLWKELAREYHPDLGNGSEKLMKQINKAYQRGDLETLRNIRKDATDIGDQIVSIEELKSTLDNNNNAIVKAENEYYSLFNSKWGVLKKNVDRAKKNKRDLLKELADKILKDIALEENEIQRLKGTYEKK